jgi:Undecaprenyl-phosphate glucose phosphotransferase
VPDSDSHNKIDCDNFAYKQKPLHFTAEIVSGLVGVGDFLTIILGAALSYLVYVQDILKAPSPINDYLVIGCIGAAFTTLLMRSLQWYDYRSFLNFPLQGGRAALALTVTFAALIVLAFFSKTSADWSRAWLLIWFLLSLGLLWTSRLALWTRLRRLENAGRFRTRVVVIGLHRMIAPIAEKFRPSADSRVDLVRLFTISDLSEEASQAALQSMLSFCRVNDIDQVVIAMPLSEEETLLNLLKQVGMLPVAVRLCFDDGALSRMFRSMSRVDGVALINVFEKPLSDWQKVTKRLFDLAIGLPAFLISAPLMLVIAILIRCESRGPVFFRQVRHGLNHSRFEVLKFRTMFQELSDVEGSKQAVPGDRRVTRAGKMLRRSSLDELPQILNVLRGDMSIVGPRPHPVRMFAAQQPYEELVDDYAARHRMKPGITGWAQVHGWRGPTTDEEHARKRIEYDLYYINNWSIWLDVKIVLMTPIAILAQKNAF